MSTWWLNINEARDQVIAMFEEFKLCRCMSLNSDNNDKYTNHDCQWVSSELRELEFYK